MNISDLLKILKCEASDHSLTLEEILSFELEIEEIDLYNDHKVNKVIETIDIFNIDKDSKYIKLKIKLY